MKIEELRKKEATEENMTEIQKLVQLNINDLPSELQLTFKKYQELQNHQIEKMYKLQVEQANLKIQKLQLMKKKANFEEKEKMVEKKERDTFDEESKRIDETQQKVRSKVDETIEEIGITMKRFAPGEIIGEDEHNLPVTKQEQEIGKITSDLSKHYESMGQVLYLHRMKETIFDEEYNQNRSKLTKVPVIGFVHTGDFGKTIPATLKKSFYKNVFEPLAKRELKNAEKYESVTDSRLKTAGQDLNTP